MRTTEGLILKRDSILTAISEKVSKDISEAILSRELPNIDHPLVAFSLNHKGERCVNVKFSSDRYWSSIAEGDLKRRWQQSNPTKIRENIIELLSIKAQWIEAFEKWDEIEQLESILNSIKG